MHARIKLDEKLTEIFPHELSAGNALSPGITQRLWCSFGGGGGGGGGERVRVRPEYR